MSEFQRGYACAIAVLIRSRGGNTGEYDALVANGLTTVEGLAEVDEYDRKIIKKFLAAWGRPCLAKRKDPHAKRD